MSAKSSKSLNVKSVDNDRLTLWFYLTWGTLAVLQFALLSSFELFGDEAFYWLEGQHLDWSYAELPGFTAWISALSEQLFPHYPVFLRLLPWLAALSLPFIGFAIAQLLNSKANSQGTKPSDAAWLMLSLPLMGVVSTLALPDIWLLLFGLLMVYLLLRAMQYRSNFDFIWLGVIVALGINVHLRFWLIAGLLVIIAVLRLRKTPCFHKLLTISLPIALLGLLPILWFNWQHDFPLFNFQLKQRHPWSFQAQHLLFVPLQWLLLSPLVFILWLHLAYSLYQKRRTLSTAKQLVFGLAVLHWLTYVVLGFFSDNLRLNIHWPLFSYLLLFTAIATINAKKLTQLAVISGVLSQALLLACLLYWQQQDPPSRLNQRVTNNATGWKQLSQKTAELLRHYRHHSVIADHFMTAAQLAYYLPEQTTKKPLTIKSLSHPLNHKHGRDLQLQLMGRQALLNEQVQALIVTEQTALKLNRQIDYYLDLCQQTKGMRLLDSLSIQSGSKIYHFFEPNRQAGCQLPIIAYAERMGTQIKGWVIAPTGQLKSLQLEQNGQTTELKYDIKGLPPTGNPMFARLPPEQYRLHQFSGTGQAQAFQLKIKQKGLSTTIDRLFF